MAREGQCRKSFYICFIATIITKRAISYQLCLNYKFLYITVRFKIISAGITGVCTLNNWSPCWWIRPSGWACNNTTAGSNMSFCFMIYNVALSIVLIAKNCPFVEAIYTLTDLNDCAAFSYSKIIGDFPIIRERMSWWCSAECFGVGR